MNGTTSPPRLTTSDIADMETDRAKARKFFRWWLGGATTLTLIGNAAHAVIGADNAVTWVRIAVHLVPPLIALIAIHGVTELARVGAVHRAQTLRVRDAGGTTVFAVLSAGALALAAAVLSYAGLRGLAESAGMHGWLAVLFPLTIDLGIAVSSVALVVLRPASNADLRAAKNAQVKTSVNVAVPSTDADTADVPAVVTSTPTVVDKVTSPRTATVTPRRLTSTATPTADVDTLALANQLVTDGKVNGDPEHVAELMSEGDIAALTELANCSTRTWYRRLAAAKEQLQETPQPELVAV